jgi:hypothetical protein
MTKRNRAPVVALGVLLGPVRGSVKTVRTMLTRGAGVGTHNPRIARKRSRRSDNPALISIYYLFFFLPIAAIAHWQLTRG